jgi:hypothetical protein
MKKMIALLALFFTAQAFANTTTYEVNCTADYSTPFGEVLIVTGQLGLTDYNQDGLSDYASGNLNIRVPYENYNQDVTAQGRIEAYAHPGTGLTYHMGTLDLSTYYGNLGDLFPKLKLMESPAHESNFMEIIINFNIYRCQLN